MRFAEPLAFVALILVPLVFVIHALAARGRRRVLERAGTVALLEEMALAGRDAGRTARSVQAGCFAVAIAFVVVALARPQFGLRTEIRKGRGMDIVFAVDLSRSMLARDVVPSRLDRARIELESLIGRLPGDRIGLVGFTTVALPLCPLTVDHGALLLQLRAASPDDLPRGGTSVGEAITAARRMFESSKAKGAAKAVVVLTDGEDHLGRADEVAKEAKEAGIEVHVIGVGSRTGEPIPIIGEDGKPGGYMKDEAGQTVVSRLDEATLEKVARAGGGLLALPGSAGGLDLGPVQSHLETLKKAELEDREVRVYEERYPWALVPGLVFLILATVIRPMRPRMRFVVRGMAALCFFLPLDARAQLEKEDPDVRRGNAALAEGRGGDAVSAYADAEKRIGNDPRLRYNQGLAEASRGELDAAISNLSRALEGSPDPNLRARAAFALGNAHRKLKKYDDAIRSYQRALLEDPRIDGARRNLELARSMKRIQDLQPKQPNEDGDEPPPEGRDGGQPDGGDKPDASDDRDGGTGEEAGQPSGEDGGSQGAPDAGRSAEDSGTAGQPPPEEEQANASEQDVEQILDALEQQEKALERKRLLQAMPKGAVEKDW
jgi:Ca-activated chloride channel family protein